MEWIAGIQRAINYIEDHLQDEIDYEAVALQSFSSSFHFQRVFSILCGYTLGEYIRNRRLTLAGAELQDENVKVIDVALKYGYESPDSFTKAFQKFHGILPSQARSKKAVLKSFSRVSIKITMEGGHVMNYRIEEKPEMILTGYKKRFSGTPAERFEKIVVPAGKYLICETDRMRYPVTQTEEVRRRAVSEWLPSSEYELSDAPEIAVTHWFYRESDAAYNQSRYVELWLPIIKKHG